LEKHNVYPLHCGDQHVWLLSAVHMIDAPPGSGARWESLWSSLTFELPAR